MNVSALFGLHLPPSLPVCYNSARGESGFPLHIVLHRRRVPSTTKALRSTLNNPWPPLPTFRYINCSLRIPALPSIKSKYNRHNLIQHKQLFTTSKMQGMW